MNAERPRDSYQCPPKQGVSQDPEPVRDDLDLAELAAAGDRQAFEEIYRRYASRVHGLCFRLTADPVAAETLTQDAFIKAWTAIGGYSGRGNLGGWLGRIAVNLHRDGIRRLVREDRLLAEASRSSEMETVTPGHVVPLLTAMDLERGIAALPAGARTVFVLHEIEGYAHREIAGLLDVATGTVKAQLHRARKLLRGILTETKEAHHES
jgi:RNA polymerase sigma factor (sigma-70 family)